MVGVAVKVTDVPLQMVPAGLAAINTLTGSTGFTVTVKLLLLKHPVAVTVSTTVYVVVTVGDTTGLARVEVKPTGNEVQLYVLPVTAAAPIWVD